MTPRQCLLPLTGPHALGVEPFAIPLKDSAKEWNAEQCRDVQRRFFTIPNPDNRELQNYFRSRERLAHIAFSRNGNRSILPWQEEGLRWLIRSEYVNQGGLLSGKLCSGK